MGAARRSVHEVVILRDDQSFERIAAGVHNAFNRVIANRADKHLQLVTTNRDALVRGTRSPNTNRLVHRLRKAYRLQLLIPSVGK